MKKVIHCTAGACIVKMGIARTQILDKNQQQDENVTNDGECS
jgi:hypothetical protein